MDIEKTFNSLDHNFDFGKIFFLCMCKDFP